MEIEKKKQETIERVLKALSDMKTAHVLGLTNDFYYMVSEIALNKYETPLSHSTISKVMNGQRVNLTYDKYLVLLNAVRDGLKEVATQSREASKMLMLKKIMQEPKEAFV